MAQFRADAVAFGFDPALADDLLLTAFRQRFAPGASGPLAPRDCAAARDLARRFAIDRTGPAA